MERCNTARIIFQGAERRYSCNCRAGGQKMSRAPDIPTYIRVAAPDYDLYGAAREIYKDSPTTVASTFINIIGRKL